MLVFLFAASQAATSPAEPATPSTIIVTASRTSEAKEKSPASAVVIDRERIDRLAPPLLDSLLRLTPSASVTTNGPAGSFTEVRIRGAESNHTLLFIDGIRANDPAAGNLPRFELLNADIASRIEVVRGPQSALWGSEAIGGIVAVGGIAEPPGQSVAIEAGSFGFARAAASAAVTAGRLSLSGAVAGQRASGIDSFSGSGDKDGYRNQSGRLRAAFALGPALELGASAFALTARNQFDGYNLATFAHEDTLDTSRNRLGAARLWVSAGSADSAWRGRISASALGSSQRNAQGIQPINRTRASRRTFDAQVEHRLSAAGIDHRLIAALEAEREHFRSRDAIYGGATDQGRSREHHSLTLNWRGSTKIFETDLAIRHDRFNRFKDVTSARASVLAALGAGFSIAASYAEGVAQPTFFDLYGFFPGSFVGSPSLKPESSHGFELSLRYGKGTVSAALTGFRQRLEDEIVDVFDQSTFLQSTVNRTASSRRSGLEAEFSWAATPALRLSSHYAFLDASEPTSGGISQSRELRRPKHSGSIAADGRWRRWTYGASLALVGAHEDRREVPPYNIVSLKPYALAGARVGYALSRNLELSVRASNLFNDRYRDAADYRTEGRGIFFGLRVGRTP